MLILKSYPSVTYSTKAARVCMRVRSCIKTVCTSYLQYCLVSSGGDWGAGGGGAVGVSHVERRGILGGEVSELPLLREVTSCESLESSSSESSSG